MIGNDYFRNFNYVPKDLVVRPTGEEVLICTKCPYPKCKGDCARFRAVKERIKNDKKRQIKLKKRV
jgi:hypothetical protein